MPITYCSCPDGASPVAETVRICLQCRRPRFDLWVGEIHWRWEWQPTPVFLPGESKGQRSLAGYRPWGCTEPHITEQLTQTHRHTHTDTLTHRHRHTQTYTHRHTHTHPVARGFENREPLLQASQRLLNAIHSRGEGGWLSANREVLIPFKAKRGIL